MNPSIHNYYLTHLFLLVVVLAGFTRAQQDGVFPSAGLFPPITFNTNFASMASVTATSTCSHCTGNSCPTRSCNDTCPFGQEVPSAFSLLETGLLSAGVERVSVSNVSKWVDVGGIFMRCGRID